MFREPAKDRARRRQSDRERSRGGEGSGSASGSASGSGSECKDGGADTTAEAALHVAADAEDDESHFIGAGAVVVHGSQVRSVCGRIYIVS